MIEHFRKRRPILIFLILFTPIGGVIGGIISEKTGVSDFNTGFKTTMEACLALSMLILGYNRFAGAFVWLKDLVPEEDWHSAPNRGVNPMKWVTGIGWLVLIVVAPLAECVLLPVDIIATIIITIIDIVNAARGVKNHAENEPADESKELIGSVEEVVSEESQIQAQDLPPQLNVSEIDRYIMKFSDFKEYELSLLEYEPCEIANGLTLTSFIGTAEVDTCEFIGNVNLTRSDSNYRLYFVYKMGYWKEEVFKDFFIALYYENVYRKKEEVCGRNDFSIGYRGTSPHFDESGDIVLKIEDRRVSCGFSTLDVLYSRLPKDCQCEFNITV